MTFKPKQRITFILRNIGYFRNIEWIISHLIQNPNITIKVVIGIRKKDPGQLLLMQSAFDALVNRYPSVEFTSLYIHYEFGRKTSHWKRLLDFNFFLHPEFPINSPAKIRSDRRMSRLELRVASFLCRKSSKSLLRSAMNVLIKELNNEKILRKMETYITNLDSDYLVIMPAVADETSILLATAARNLNISTIGIVTSWDNLSIKGQFIDVYDKLILCYQKD